MQVQLETSGVAIPRNEGQVLISRVRDAFARVASRTERLHLSLKDDNGPRGGRDKICTIRAYLTNGRQVIVRERSSKMQKAISKSIRRGRVLVVQQIKPRVRRNLNVPVEARAGI